MNALSLFVLVPALSFGQAPTAEDVKGLRERYAEEKTKTIAEGVDKVFVPGLVDRADDLAKRAEAALAGGRLFQAAELYRQARWQLPYLPGKRPDHVARVFGNFRLRHGMEVTATDYSPDGRYLASGSTDRSVKLWDLANGREFRTYLGHADQVRAIAFHPGGKLIATGGAEPEIHLWEIDTGKLVRRIAGPGNYVTSLAFSKDGKTLAAGHAGKTGGTSGHVTLTDVDTGERKRTIQDFRQLVQSVAFNKAGTILAVGVNDGAVRLYQYPQVVENANTPEFWSKQENGASIYYVCFSADDKTLIRCGSDGIKIYAVAQPDQAFQVSNPLRAIPGPAPEEYYPVAATSADSKTLIAGGTDGVLRMIDLETGQVVSSLRGHTGSMRSLSLHPRGIQIATTGADCLVRLWDFDIVLQARDYVGHESPVWSAVFRGDGKKLASASADGTIRVWDVGTGATGSTGPAEPPVVLKGHAGPVTMALFTPDGKNVVSVGADRTVKVWDTERKAVVREWVAHAGTVTALDISSDGKRLLTGGADRAVKVWNFATGKQVLDLAGQSSVVASVAFHPDGGSFAVGNVDQTIGLYDAKGKQLHRWPAHGIAVSGVAFSPNGKRLASCGADGVVRVWSVELPSDSPISLVGHTGPLSSVAFRKDSQHLVSCGADLSVKLWKLEGEAGKEVQAYRGHRDWVSSAAFSADGFHIVSASVDRSVKVWEITSKDLPISPEHSGSVDVVAFSPDGRTVASAGSDHTIKIWDRATGAELATIRGHTASVISLSYSPDSKTLASSSIDRTIRFWDAAQGKELFRSPTQQATFTGMITSSPLIALASDAKTLLAWIPGPPDQRYTQIVAYDLEGNEKYTVSDQGRKIHSLCFSGDGRRAATGAANGSVRVWDLDKRAVLPGGDWFFYDEKTSVADLALSPDGTTIVVTSDQGDIKIAEVAKRNITKTIKGHPSRIVACLASPDGKRFATMDGENQIKLWDLATGEQLRHWDLRPLMQDQLATIVSLAFSPDGKQLATGNANTTMFLLDAP